MDLISRQAAIDALWKVKDERDSVYYTSAIHTAVETLEQLPSAQPEPKTGRWIKMSDSVGTYHCCSRCGREGTRMWKYCPHCGTKMEVNTEE